MRLFCISNGTPCSRAPRLTLSQAEWVFQPSVRNGEASVLILCSVWKLRLISLRSFKSNCLYLKAARWLCSQKLNSTKFPWLWKVVGVVAAIWYCLFCQHRILRPYVLWYKNILAHSLKNNPSLNWTFKVLNLAKQLVNSCSPCAVISYRAGYSEGCCRQSGRSVCRNLVYWGSHSTGRTTFTPGRGGVKTSEESQLGWLTVN